MTDIDVDKLITLVQEIPQLWDRTLEVYKDRNKTRQNWILVCSALHHDYDELSDNEKKNYCQLIVKRWNNIRDQWMKWKKKENESKKSGAGASKLRKYVYHEALQFLEKVRVHAETTSNMQEEIPIQGEGQQDDTVDESGGDSINNQQTTNTVPTVNKPSYDITKKKKKMDEFELRMLKAVETPKRDEDRHLSFFKGIIPSISKFSEPQIVEFQLGVLQLVQKIQQVTPPTQVPHSFVNYQQPLSIQMQQQQQYMPMHQPNTGFNTSRYAAPAQQPCSSTMVPQYHQLTPRTSETRPIYSQAERQPMPSPAESEQTQMDSMSSDHSDVVYSPNSDLFP